MSNLQEAILNERKADAFRVKWQLAELPKFWTGPLPTPVTDEVIIQRARQRIKDNQTRNNLKETDPGQYYYRFGYLICKTEEEYYIASGLAKEYGDKIRNQK